MFGVQEKQETGVEHRASRTRTSRRKSTVHARRYGDAGREHSSSARRIQGGKDDRAQMLLRLLAHPTCADRKARVCARHHSDLQPDAFRQSRVRSTRYEPDEHDGICRGFLRRPQCVGEPDVSAFPSVQGYPVPEGSWQTRGTDLARLRRNGVDAIAAGTYLHQTSLGSTEPS